MRWTAAAAFVLALAAAPAARGAEDELIVAAEPAYAALTAGEATRHGAGGAASAWLGLTDTLWLAASAGALHHLEADGAEAATVAEAMGGLVAALDVFRVVPFVEALAGVVVGDGDGRLFASVRLGVGADYLVTPELFVGLVGRYRPLPDELGTASLSAHARLGWRFGW